MTIQFPSYENIKYYVIQNLELCFEFQIDPSSFFEKNKDDLGSSFKNIYSIEPIFYEWNGFRFPVFIHNNHQNVFTKNGNLSFDIFLNSFLFLSGYLELISEERDHHNRFPFEASLQKKYDFNQIPVVNIYFKLLEFIAKEQNEKFEEKKFANAIIFTHDIDQFRSGWFENIQYHLKNFTLKSLVQIPKNLLTKVFKRDDDYFLAMKKMIAIDKKHNVNSISFFIAKKSKMDADFEITKPSFLKLFKESEKYQNIGFHPGYDTFNNIEEFTSQKKKLESISNNKITKSRQHFLRFEMSKTPYIIQENEIEEDYTLGFAEEYGFRNGIANPFYLFDFKQQKAFDFKCFPLVFMDVTLTNYSKEKDFDSVFLFIQDINSKFNCNYSVLFHNSVFTEAKYKGFEKFYLKLIQYMIDF